MTVEYCGKCATAGGYTTYTHILTTAESTFRDRQSTFRDRGSMFGDRGSTFGDRQSTFRESRVRSEIGRVRSEIARARDVRHRHRGRLQPPTVAEARHHRGHAPSDPSPTAPHLSTPTPADTGRHGATRGNTGRQRAHGPSWGFVRRRLSTSHGRQRRPDTGSRVAGRSHSGRSGWVGDGAGRGGAGTAGEGGVGTHDSRRARVNNRSRLPAATDIDFCCALIRPRPPAPVDHS